MPKVVPTYKEEAKSRIVEAASKVFSEKGYHQATMEDVARRIGVSKGVLYLYFRSKEELFNEMCKTGVSTLRDTLRESFTGGDLLENAKLFFDATLKDSGDSLGFQLELLSEAMRNQRIKKIHRDSYRETLEVLTSFIEEKKGEGLVKREMDARSLAMGLMGLYDGLRLSLVAGFEESDVKRAWEESMRAMLFGAGQNRR